MKRLIVCVLGLGLGLVALGCDKDNKGSETCDEGVQRTMGCEEGVKTQKCEAGEWVDITECGDPTGPDFVCKSDDEKTVLCDNGTGLQQMVCKDNAWTEVGDCITIKCTEGATQTIPCPSDPEKEVVQTCKDGKWETGDTCQYPGQVCTENEEIEVECGLDGNQTQTMKCVKGQWTFVGSCAAEDCIDGEAKEVACGPSYDMVQRKKCIDGTWQDLGGCVTSLTPGTLLLKRRVINDDTGTPQIQQLLGYEGTALISTEIHIRNSNDNTWLPVIIMSTDPKTASTKQIITTIAELDLLSLMESVRNWNDDFALSLLPDETKVVYWDYIEIDARGRITQYATRNDVGKIIFRGTYSYDETYPAALRTATLSYIDSNELQSYLDPALAPVLGNPAYFGYRGDEILMGTGEKVTTNIEFLFGDKGPVGQFISSMYLTLYREKTLRQITSKGALLKDRSLKVASDNVTILPIRYFENLDSTYYDLNYEYDGDAVVSYTAKDNRAATVKSITFTYDGNGNWTNEDCSSTKDSYEHCISDFDGAPASNYAIALEYDTENRLTHYLQTIDHDGNAGTDPLTIEEWTYEEGNPLTAYTRESRTFCAIIVEYPWLPVFIQNAESCSKGPENGKVTYEIWSYDDQGRITGKTGYAEKEDATGDEEDNPLYTQKIDYVGEDATKPTEIVFSDNFSTDNNPEKKDFATVWTFEYLEDGWVVGGNHDQYYAMIPAAEADYCAETEGDPTVADCNGELCTDADEDGLINIETECTPIYEDTPTRDLNFERLYIKYMDGDLQKGFELREEGVTWHAIDLDGKGGVTKWTKKDPLSGDPIIEKVINPVYSPYIDYTVEPLGDWGKPFVLDAKKYDAEGTVVEEYQIDPQTGWPLHMACTAGCEDITMMIYEFYNAVGYAKEWFLFLNHLPFDLAVDNMDETYVYNPADNTAKITLKISEGENELATVWQRTTRKAVQTVDWGFGPMSFPFDFVMRDKREFADAISVPAYWDDSDKLQYLKVAHYSDLEQTYDDETGVTQITHWVVKYNTKVDEVTTEIEHTLVSSEAANDGQSEWSCNYLNCYAGAECTWAKSAGLGSKSFVPCNDVTIKDVYDNATHTKTRSVTDRKDRIWNETTTVYAGAATADLSERTSRRRLEAAFEEEGNEDSQFETTLHEVYEEFGGNWLITEYYALVNDSIFWQRYSYDENYNISKKEFLEPNGNVATWHDYFNTYLAGSKAIIHTIIKDEYGTPLGSIDYFWTNP